MEEILFASRVPTTTVVCIRTCDYVADTRDGFENHPEDTK